MIASTRTASKDDGFTLVEVIVALALMSIVATAALYFFVGGQRAVVQQTRAQAAVTVANDAMELAYSVPAKEVEVTLAGGAKTRVSGLVAGRARTAVETAWNSATGVEALAQTYPAWDPQVDAGEQPAVPLLDQHDVNGADYDATVLVGTCYRPTRSTAQEDCTRLPGHVSDPGAAPAGYVKHMRVIVHVRWLDTSSACGTSGCDYTATSLLDPNEDAVWNNTTRPVAMDDVAVVSVGGSVDIPVILNDSIGRVVSEPIEVQAAPPAGRGTAVRVGDGRNIRYTAPSSWSGPVEFTYRLKDQAGRLSNTATVRVSVSGIAVDDNVSAVRNQPTTIPVTTNDRGVATRVEITAPPTGATATASGTSVLFTAPTAGTYEFRYKFWSTDTIESTQAVVRVTVTNYPPPLAPNLDIAIPASMTGNLFDFDMTGRTTNPNGYRYEIMSVQWVNGEKLMVGGQPHTGANKSSTQLGFQQQGNALGGVVFTYRAITPDGVASQPPYGTARAVVVPLARDDTFQVRSGSSGNNLFVGGNDTPSNFGGTVRFSAASVTPPGGSCGSLTSNPAEAGNGRLIYNAPTLGSNQQTRTCTFTYQFTGAAPYETMQSNPATVTVTVTKW